MLCAKCGDTIVKSDGADGIYYHEWSGVPPCNPHQVDPDAYTDTEGDKYDIATPPAFSSEIMPKSAPWED